MRLDSLPELAHLCRTLCAAYGEVLLQASPVLRRQNAWGEFVPRAYCLNAADFGSAPHLIGIIVERREARFLGLWRKIEGLDLTGREKELSLLLARGADTGYAAETMEISESTVISHRRSIYQKLGVENRSTLIARLHGG